jgi:putative ABC transport system ATP-binding protein
VILEARGLRKVFAQGAETLTILDGVDFDLRQGETVAVVGQSGSGKSTLLGLLSGLDTPTNGRVSIEGKDLSAMGEGELTAFRSKKVGIVFQHFHLISTLTALENVRLPLEVRKDPKADEKAREWLDLVGLTPRAGHFPRQMSGGEQQRVAIARALSSEPAVLFGDEPSGSLDNETGRRVIELLFDLVAKRGLSLVLVTHNEELAARCARQVRLERGRLR